ncbi:hypothetical protein FJT64_003788 [Amphibalanus amphitrite]|uniref:Uncharacterized protein n=1 Tax=Amphibalanus amphitrite TaxID=1232801 RepID=A0A6A4W9W1_AMPAM|nr:hypothetical protein FJT64_003788 [Amphibalanus amphitrite]
MTPNMNDNMVMGKRSSWGWLDALTAGPVSTLWGLVKSLASRHPGCIARVVCETHRMTENHTGMAYLVTTFLSYLERSALTSCDCSQPASTVSSQMSQWLVDVFTAYPACVPRTVCEVARLLPAALRRNRCQAHSERHDHFVTCQMRL